jgi:ribosomal protein L32E
MQYQTSTFEFSEGYCKNIKLNALIYDSIKCLKLNKAWKKKRGSENTDRLNLKMKKRAVRDTKSK